MSASPAFSAQCTRHSTLTLICGRMFYRKHFEKVYLTAGESTVVSFVVTLDDCSFYGVDTTDKTIQVTAGLHDALCCVQFGMASVTEGLTGVVMHRQAHLQSGSARRRTPQRRCR